MGCYLPFLIGLSDSFILFGGRIDDFPFLNQPGRIGEKSLFRGLSIDRCASNHTGYPDYQKK